MVAVSILALTIGVSLGRPKVGPLRIHHTSAAVLGALSCLVLGLVPLDLALITLRQLLFPLVTIVSLMTMTLIAERAGLLDLIAGFVARSARGSGKRLFNRIFVLGTLTGTVFTNDAAVLIFTPLVFALIEEIREDDWTTWNRVPYYFAVLYVGNLVGALVISNPINIIVASMFDISFVEYAAWMVLPAVASMLVTFAGMRVFFRDLIPARCKLVAEGRSPLREPRLARVCAAVLLLTLAGFFTEGWSGLPAWLIAFTGAAVSFSLYVGAGHRPGPIIRGIGWDVIVFVMGIFIVVVGVRNAGFTHVLGRLIADLAGEGIGWLTMVTALVAGACSSVMNNHPTAGLMIWVIQDFSLSDLHTKMLVFAALIGGDLGPKMLPIGSLAALMWFRLLRDRGVDVPYSLYVRIGVPVTLLAIVLSVLTLLVELSVVSRFGS